jgi:hypothetical protein
MAHHQESSAGLPDDLLAHGLELARTRLELLDRQIKEMVSERESASREVQLLEELLTLRQGEPDQPAPAQSKIESSRDPAGRNASRVVGEVIAELEHARKPLHISELMHLLEERHVPLPGAGKQANVIALLTRDERIVRPSRGMYALASAGFQEKPKLKPAVRRRTRGKSRTNDKETDQ